MPAYPGQYNTWVPSFEDSNRLLVDFSRNPRDFSLNKYVQIVPVKKSIGYYLQMTLEERMRILNSDLVNFRWPDGQDAPIGNEGSESFNFLQFTCQRYSYSFNLGDMAVEQAAWDISAQHLDIKAQQAMTARTQLAVTQLTTSGNYAASHVLDQTATPWSAATTANLYIKKAIDLMVQRILLDTGAVVRKNDLFLVVNPVTARIMAESQELVDYLKGSPTALAFVRGETDEGSKYSHALFGLPPTYAGVNIVVEDAVKVTSKKAATLAQSFVLGNTDAYMVSRPGGLEGRYGGPSFSTISVFVYDKDDMAVEVRHDIDNRRTQGRVVDTLVPVITAPVSGGLFQNIA